MGEVGAVAIIELAEVLRIVQFHTLPHSWRNERPKTGTD